MAKNGPSCGTDLDLVKRELIALLNIKSKNYRGVRLIRTDIIKFYSGRHNGSVSSIRTRHSRNANNTGRDKRIRDKTRRWATIIWALFPSHYRVKWNSLKSELKKLLFFSLLGIKTLKCLYLTVCLSVFFSFLFKT